MGTYDFDRFKDNSNTYLCKDTKGRELLETTSVELTKQMQELSSDTDTKLNELKESLKDRYVLIGDSYMEGYTPDGNVESFAYKLKRMLNAQDDDFIISYYGGVGFVNTVDDKTYKTLTQEAYNNTTNPETITHVIYAGGYNDSPYTSEKIQTAINECYTKMHELFPNAVMYLANIGSTFKNHEVLWHLHDNVQHSYDYAGGLGKVCSLGYIGNALHERDMMASDGKHPTEWGQLVIATALSYKLRGGEYQPVGRFIDFNASSTTPGTSSSVVKGKEFFNKDILTLLFHRIDFSVMPSIPTEIAWSVGNISDMKYVRDTYHYMASMQTTGIVAYDGGSKFRTCSMTIAIAEGGVITVRLHTLNKDDTNYEVLNNIKFITFDDATLRVPLCYI